MSKSKTAPDPDLPLSTEPDWQVVTWFQKQSISEKQSGAEPKFKGYRLMYGDAIQQEVKGAGCHDSLREVARHLNRHKQKPRPRIQCAADCPSPETYIKGYAK